MATESVAPVAQRAPSAKVLSDLSGHDFTMDGGTARLLFKIQGIAQMIRTATDELRVDEPIPDGVVTSMWAIEDLATDALKRAGLALEDEMKRTKVVSGKGKIVGVLRANGGWLFAVQAFSKSNKSQPVLFELRNAADLGGSARRKAERWLEYLS